MKFCRNCGAALADAAPPEPPPPLEIAPTAVASGSRAPASTAGGSPLSAQRRPCPHCGVPTPSGFRFCQNCGKEIPAGPALPAADQPQLVSGLVSGTIGSGSSAQIAQPGSDLATAPTFEPSRPVRVDTPVTGGAGVAGFVPAPGARSAWGTLCSVNRDGSDGGAYPLATDWVDVGRDADLRFDDPYLAPRHARFTMDSGAPTVTSLDDLNGVYVRASGRIAVSSGTRLLLGRELLVIDVLRDEERQVPPLWRHGTSMLGSPVRPAWGRLSQIVPNGSVRDVRYLVTDEVVIGREEGDVVFGDDEFLSRRHCKLSWDGRRCALEDLGSSNGTFVRITAPWKLSSGDHLRMGDQMFRFER